VCVCVCVCVCVWGGGGGPLLKGGGRGEGDGRLLGGEGAKRLLAGSWRSKHVALQQASLIAVPVPVSDRQDRWPLPVCSRTSLSATCEHMTEFCVEITNLTFSKRDPHFARLAGSKIGRISPSTSSSCMNTYERVYNNHYSPTCLPKAQCGASIARL
jgi:hypothetical protein